MNNGPFQDSGKSTRTAQKPPFRPNVVGLLASLAILGILVHFFSGGFHGQRVKQISYTSFVEQVSLGKVKQITMKGKHVTGVYKQAKKIKSRRQEISGYQIPDKSSGN